jgi:hypothetical protein
MSNQDFIDLILDEHGVYVASEELRSLQIELFERAQERRLVPYDSGELVEISADFGKILFVVGGAILGGFLLPGLGLVLPGIGGVSTFLGGALLGAAIGYRLANYFDGGGTGADQAPTIQSQNAFVFGSTGELISLGAQVPVVYTNALNNTYTNADGELEGGLYVEAKTVYTRIAPTQGSQTLTKIGVLSGGRLAEVNQATLLLGDQKRENFGLLDITTEVSSGAFTQAALGGVSDYCQATSQNSNSYLGVGAGVTAQTVAYPAAATITAQNLVNATFTTGTLLKTAGGAGAWDAGGRSQSITLTAKYGDFVEFSAKAGQLATAKAIGISTANTTANLADMNFALVLRADNKYEIFVGNVSQFVSGGSYTTAQVFSLRVYTAYPTNYLQVLVDGVEVWRATTAISGAVFGDYSLFTTAASLASVAYRVGDSLTTLGAGYNPADFLAGIGKRFQMLADRMDLFKNEAIYTSATGGDLKVVSKSPAAGWIEFDRAIWVTDSATQVPLSGQGIIGGSKIYPRYTTTLSTTKAVDRLEVVILASLDARDASGNLAQFGVAFEVSMDDGTGYQALGRVMISAKSANQLYRSFLVGNLPKKNYKVKLRALLESEISAPIDVIGEAGNLQTSSTSANFGIGAVTWQYDKGIAYTAAEAKVIVDPVAGGKTRTSADNGPPARVTHLNEIVGSLTAPTYGGFTLGLQKLTASDRVQSAPTTLWDIQRGRICRQHYAAGIATSTSGVDHVDDVTAHFIDDGISVGDTVRLLDRSYQRVITALTQTALTCTQYTAVATLGANPYRLVLSAANVNLKIGMPVTGAGIPANAFIEEISGANLVIGDSWGRLLTCTITPSTTITINGNSAIRAGDRYVVFGIGASNYLPDAAIDRLINPLDGLGGLVDQDNFVHYPSMVKSRRFCKERNYFYDAVVEGGSFETWLTEVAPSSLLFPTKVEGQYALIPERNERVSAIFNAANLIDYAEPYTDWAAQAINTVLVKFSDKRGREQQRKIQTPAAAAGTESEITQNIDLKGVRNPEQAIDVGCVGLKSLRSQNRVCQITTDFAGLTCQHGDIIRTQHAIVEYDQEKSGWVTAIQPPTNSRTAISGTITNIYKTLPGGGTTIISCDRPHGLIDGDMVVITGHSSSPLNTTVAIDVYDDSRFSVPVAYAAGAGGIIRHQRTIVDQVVTLSEEFAITGTNRISIGHRNPSTCELDLLLSLSSGVLTIIGLERAISVGDLFIVGDGVLDDRTWRIHSLKPQIGDNKAEITAVVWSADILTRDGLVIS